MTPTEEHDRQIMARASFKRLLIYTCIAGVLMVAAALFFLSLFSALTIHMVIATSVGVFVSVLLGAGLMAAGFLSSNSGYDEKAADHRDHSQPGG